VTWGYDQIQEALIQGGSGAHRGTISNSQTIGSQMPGLEERENQLFLSHRDTLRLEKTKKMKKQR